ncbi:MAG: alanyl-tRNA editing protein [Anaerolineae bacterium]
MGATRRLDRESAYTQSFDALVLEQVEREGKPGVVLDATCFYPTAGGQPNDLGTLNGVAVLDVIEEEGTLVHLLADPLPLGPVQGAIDWARRFDHMQQHSGQHILSQAFEQVLHAPTVSFHLGEEVSTIDLDLPTCVPNDVARVEDLANRILFEDRPVSIREVAPEDVAALGLRKPPAVEGLVRVVRVEDFDTSACGGTHVRSTGEIGCLHIARCERRHGGVRIQFLCGGRALHDYRAKDAILQQVAGGLSVAVDDLPRAVARMQEEEQDQRRQAEALRRRLLAYEAPALATQAEEIAGVRVVCRLLEGYDAQNARSMATSLTEAPGMVALLAVTEPSPQLCLARSSDVNLDVGTLLREALQAFGGRGGGRPHMAQGGGVPVERLPDVLEWALQQARVRLQ